MPMVEVSNGGSLSISTQTFNGTIGDAGVKNAQAKKGYTLYETMFPVITQYWNVKDATSGWLVVPITCTYNSSTGIFNFYAPNSNYGAVKAVTVYYIDY